MRTTLMNKQRLGRLFVCPLLLAVAGWGQETASEGPRTDIAVPSGPALAEGEVIILLQAKVPLEIIQKFVSTRGVNFVSTKETSKRILASGGNVALVGTINLNQKDEAVPLAVNNGKDNKDKKK
jgi:hypothetical protein